jgi:hypothetical protein
LPSRRRRRPSARGGLPGQDPSGGPPAATKFEDYTVLTICGCKAKRARGVRPKCSEARPGFRSCRRRPASAWAVWTPKVARSRSRSDRSLRVRSSSWWRCSRDARSRTSSFARSTSTAFTRASPDARASSRSCCVRSNDCEMVKCSAEIVFRQSFLLTSSCWTADSFSRSRST